MNSSLDSNDIFMTLIDPSNIAQDQTHETNNESEERSNEAITKKRKFDEAIGSENNGSDEESENNEENKLYYKLQYKKIRLSGADLFCPITKQVFK